MFLSRMFRHSAIFVRNDRGFDSPKNLKGCRIGVPEYAQTAAMTARGILQDDFGVSPRDMLWFTGGLEQPGRHEKFALNIPGVTITHMTDKEPQPDAGRRRTRCANQRAQSIVLPARSEDWPAVSRSCRD